FEYRVHRLAIGLHEAADDVRVLLQIVCVDGEHAHGLVFEDRSIVAVGDNTDVALVELIEPVRRCRPADVDLTGHHLHYGRGRASSRDEVRLMPYCWI